MDYRVKTVKDKTKNFTHVYTNKPDKIFNNETRDNKTFSLTKDNVDDDIEHILLDVLEQNRRFIK